MFDTRSGKSTMPYSKAQEEQATAILRERKEKKELLRQAKMKMIAEEQAAKKKKLEEEMQILQQEEEERMRAAKDEEVEEEEEQPEEEPLKRRRLGEGEGSNGTKEDDPRVERRISEWVANLSSGEDEEVMLYIPQEEKEAAIREIEAASDPLERQAIENEKRLDWKLRLAREKKRGTEEANRMVREVESLQTCRQEVEAQPNIWAKLDKILGSIKLLGRAWTEHHQSVRGQEMALHSTRSGFRDFARDVMKHVGTEVRKLKDNAEKFCAGAVEGAKVVAAAESEGCPHKESVKLKFPDSYGGKKDDNFDNWEASINTYRSMNDVFRPWLDKFVVVYLDDILVFSRTLQEHQGHLRQVLEKLREANFKINAKKCEWVKTQVLYLGHVLDGDGIRPEDSKIAAIRDWSTPRTMTEVRSFLGLANYYKKFVRNFSSIAAPLRRLLKKEAIWKWDKDCTSALEKLKRALIEYPILKVADPSLRFVVTMDASQYGIGAVLQQDDCNGYRPVEFMSARMPSETVATSTYGRELYPLRQTSEHWKHYLLGRHFKVYSDHETRRWLKTQAKMTPKLTRWAAEIDQYDFELKLVKGKYNVVADALSRRSYYFGTIVHYLDIGRDLQEKVRQAYA
ncbi:hypothetical protein CBR_g36914 [Chara braunii]|uniref:Reverse transcriptase domain-containing protein n=1 Tax=Chara braunii TaxID=69332 RepID=A0A388JZF2_CHABU|nr:hypothetical protein CBR_g36914 [Chara braunii]|eukprot:GBG63145.1 hypothetical protein CBR_g36914 [Chara braunii]